MQTKTSENLLNSIINLLLSYLEELSSATSFDKDQFLYGEKTAYTECLEWLQTWEHAGATGLNFDIEERFPL